MLPLAALIARPGEAAECGALLNAIVELRTLIVALFENMPPTRSSELFPEIVLLRMLVVLPAVLAAKASRPPLVDPAVLPEIVERVIDAPERPNRPPPRRA